MKDRSVINKSGTVIDESIVGRYKAEFHGTIVRPGDPDYHTARKVWNGMIDKFPSIIAYCSDKDDVINTVNFARSNNLPAAVRSGGHNVAGNAVCNDGIVIDLSRMKKIGIDADSRTAVAQAGLTLGELDNATQAYGLAVPVGIVTKTGMAGLTLGGGIGWLVRKHGLTCDNLLSAEVVTAYGQLLTAGADENPDLFWGIRGGGGNFGIVTEFTFGLHPVKQVIGGMILYPAADAHEVVRFYRQYISHAPDELTTMLAFLPAPAPFLSRRIENIPLVAVHVCYSGPLGAGEKILQPLRSFGRPLQDMIKIIPFLEMQSMLDAGAPPGLLNYWKSSYLKNLDDDVMKKILWYFNKVPSPLTQIHIQHLQGAMGRVKEDETAFSHRSALCVLNIVSKWIDLAASEINIQWTHDLSKTLEPYAAGAYVNFMGDEGQERVKAAYSTENYNRLIQLKNRYDPSNFFSLNQNIKPGA